MKTKDEVINGFMERHCALLMDANMPAYNTIRSQLGGIWRNGYMAGINCSEQSVEAAKHRWYEEGYDKGKAESYQELSGWTPRESKDMINEAYQRGLTDAWETARKIVSTDGLDYRELIGDFRHG